MRSTHVPAGFLHPLFYRQGDIIERKEIQPFPMMMKELYFYYDIIGTNKPWQCQTESIPAVLSLWNSEKELLVNLYKQRNRKAAREPMLRGLSYFLSCLFWLNGTPVNDITKWVQKIEELEAKPINCVERLEFIFCNCDLYHAFIQLCELFDELAKLFYKHITMNQDRRNR